MLCYIFQVKYKPHSTEKNNLWGYIRVQDMDTNNIIIYRGVINWMKKCYHDGKKLLISSDAIVSSL
jgi:hypothetical protein